MVKGSGFFLLLANPGYFILPVVNRTDGGSMTDTKEVFIHQHFLVLQYNFLYPSSYMLYICVPFLPFCDFSVHLSTPCLLALNTLHLSNTVSAHLGWDSAPAPLAVTTKCAYNEQKCWLYSVYNKELLTGTGLKKKGETISIIMLINPLYLA